MGRLSRHPDGDAKPNLFIIGAPKCGTSSLYYWLSQHPEVFVTKKKELNHFYAPARRRPISRAKYLGYYSNVKPAHKAIVEVSVWYLFSRIAIDRVLRFNPEARFLVCLRNPAEMLPTLHTQQIYAGLEGEYDLEKAWDLSDERAAGHFSGLKKFVNRGDPSHMAYKLSCRLGAQVADLLEKVDQGRVKFVLLDDIRNDQTAVYRDICRFIGVSDFSASTDLSARNRGQDRRGRKLDRLHAVVNAHGWLKKMVPDSVFEYLTPENLKVAKTAEMSPSFKRKVKRYFAEDVEMLQSLIDRDLSDWR